MKRTVYVVFLASLLTGCAIAPGMKMEDPPPSFPGVKIMPITAELIYKQRVNGSPKAARPGAAASLWSEKRYQYRIGPRDVLSIIVWGHPDLTVAAGQPTAAEAAGHLVAENGTIFFPYVGSVKVAGKTVVEVREILTQRIKRTLVVDPQVDVRVIAYRSQKVYVTGKVQRPGLLPITDVPLTVIEAVNRAGGLIPDADSINVRLSRNGKVYRIDLLAMYEEGDTSQNRLLKDGDILSIPDRSQRQVFVLGEVAKPSSLLMNKRRMSLTEALGNAGGVDPETSSPARIYVIRANRNEAEIYHLNARSPDALLLGEQFQLKPRDVVYVETAAVTRWSRVINQLVPNAFRIGGGFDID